MKTTAQKLRLGLRYTLKHNENDDLRNIWQLTSVSNIAIDSLLGQHSKSSAVKKLQSDQLSKVVEHISSLKVQGKSFSAVREAFDEASIKSWSSMVNDLLSGMLFTFVRKAFQQQLPTASNLYRWKKSDSDKCSLCGLVQTNKHSLNNCGSSAALSRYKTRHDRILEILARWIITVVKDDDEVFVDLNEQSFKPVSNLFHSMRPDIVIKSRNYIATLELTICHESNAIASKNYKISKYKNLKQNILPPYSSYKLLNYTIEVTTLGFISDISEFCKTTLTEQMPVAIKQLVFRSVISESYSIYCMRNTI